MVNQFCFFPSEKKQWKYNYPPAAGNYNLKIHGGNSFHPKQTGAAAETSNRPNIGKYYTSNGPGDFTGKSHESLNRRTAGGCLQLLKMIDGKSYLYM